MFSRLTQHRSVWVRRTDGRAVAISRCVWLRLRTRDNHSVVHVNIHCTCMPVVISEWTTHRGKQMAVALCIQRCFQSWCDKSKWSDILKAFPWLDRSKRLSFHQCRWSHKPPGWCGSCHISLCRATALGTIYGNIQFFENTLVYTISFAYDSPMSLQDSVKIWLISANSFLPEFSCPKMTHPDDLSVGDIR